MISELFQASLSVYKKVDLTQQLQLVFYGPRFQSVVWHCTVSACLIPFSVRVVSDVPLGRDTLQLAVFSTMQIRSGVSWLRGSQLRLPDGGAGEAKHSCLVAEKTSLSLRKLSLQALTLSRGVGFIAWHLRYPFLWYPKMMTNIQDRASLVGTIAPTSIKKITESENKLTKEKTKWRENTVTAVFKQHVQSLKSLKNEKNNWNNELEL